MRVAAFVLLGFTAVAAAQGLSAEARAKAEQLWARYMALEAAFDPAMADLYADSALIQNRRTYPTGEARTVTLPAAQYKLLVRQAMPLAKARGDINRYSECRFTERGTTDRVRIVCSRYSVLKNYTSPVALLVGPGPTGAWLIFEELSESQP
jgi:hypothetical protein